jgi:hypothetical protein
MNMRIQMVSCRDCHRAELFETATARHFLSYLGVAVAMDESELTARLDRIDEMAAQPTSLGKLPRLN